MRDALSVEYKKIVEAGLILQIDDALLAYWYELTVPPGSLQDYRRWVAVRVEALNHALEGIPPEMSRYHLCWGSWNAPHMADVPLKDIIDLVLRINVGAYLLEAANPRHEHEWKAWRGVKLPEGRKLAPGVVSHATNVVEHPEVVADRIERYANVVGRRPRKHYCQYGLRIRARTPYSAGTSDGDVGETASSFRRREPHLGSSLAELAQTAPTESECVI